MIFGVGTDIVLISRIKNNKSFAEKILSKNELGIWKDLPDQKQQIFLAKQFACKEALVKALGTGFRGEVFPKNIEILRDDLGKPYINSGVDLSSTFDDLGIVNTHVSIADETDYVIAFVILEK
ncbi:MAG: holo-ACP synthase [Gammaproteobacteria bacterium]